MSNRATDPETVHTLLAAAGLHLPADDLAVIAAGYPALRARLDAAHSLDLPEGTTPDLTLRPSIASASTSGITVARVPR